MEINACFLNSYMVYLYIVPVAPGSLFRLALLAQQLCNMHSIINGMFEEKSPFSLFFYFLGKTS
jgi:hypothetical protein